MIYADDCILIPKEDTYIDDIVDKTHDHKFELEHEYQSITSFLGLDIANSGTVNYKTIKLTMACHIDLILDLTVMNDCTPNDTPDIKHQ